MYTFTHMHIHRSQSNSDSEYLQPDSDSEFFHSNSDSEDFLFVHSDMRWHLKNVPKGAGRYRYRDSVGLALDQCVRGDARRRRARILVKSVCSQGREGAMGVCMYVCVYIDVLCITYTGVCKIIAHRATVS